MQRLEIGTKEVTTPTGILVTLKAKKTRGDSNAIMMQAFGDAEVSEGLKPKLKDSLEMVDATLQRMIVSWDITESDGTATPVNSDTLGEVLTDDDVTFLMTEIDGKSEDKKKS
jgi:hypothetical protein